MRTSAKERQRLVDENLSFVRAVAAKLKEALPQVEFEDLVGFGMTGLLEAAERFDPRHGVAFTTFAYYRVRGAMFDGLRRMGWLLGRNDWKTRADERATAFLGNTVERDAGAARLGAPTPSLEDEVRSISETLAGLAAIFLATLDASPEAAAAVEPHRQLETRERARAIREAIARLPEKERQLLQLYYYEDKSLEEAGEALGLSKSWSSRLHARAIALLKEALKRSPAAPER